MAAHEYMDSYFEAPELLEVALDDFRESVAVKVRVMTSGLATEPPPPFVVSVTATVTEQLSEAVACAGLAAGTRAAHS